MRINPTLLGFLRKELGQTLRDPRMRGILFVTPVIQLLLFGVAISTEVKNVRLAARFAPGDTVMREYYDHALASGWFIPAEGSARGDGVSGDPFEEVRSGVADAVLVGPPGGLTHGLGRALTGSYDAAPAGGRSDVQLLINASNVVKAQATEVYLGALLRETLAVHAQLPQGDLPIGFQIRVLYNPTLETAYFMVPGVMCLLVCMMTLIITSTAVSREKEMGTMEMLISAPISATEVILGKTVPYVILGMVNFPLVLAAAVILFNVPVRGPIYALMVAAFFFVCTTVAVGLLISTISRNQQQAMLGGFLYLFPAILLSGIIYPLENMPTVMLSLAYLDPLSHFVGLLRNIMLKGGEWRYIVLHVGVLALMAIVTAGISFKRFHTTLQ